MKAMIIRIKNEGLKKKLAVKKIELNAGSFEQVIEWLFKTKGGDTK